MGPGRLEVVIRAVTHDERLARRNTERAQAGGQQPEHVRIGFAEAVGKRKKTKVGREPIPRQSHAGQRRVQFVHRIGLAVGGQAEEQRHFLGGAKDIGGVGPEAHGVQEVGAIDRGRSPRRGRPRIESPQHGVDDIRPINLGKLDAPHPRGRVLDRHNAPTLVVELRQTQRRGRAQRHLAGHGPAGPGVRRRRPDLKQGPIKIEDGGAEAHAHRLHVSG